MFSSIAPLLTLWRWLTEPAAAIVQPEARQRARAVASILILTILVIGLPLLENFGTSPLPSQLVAMLIIAFVSYGLSRTRYYRVGGIAAIAALWLLSTQIMVSSAYSTPSFLLSIRSIARPVMLALLFTYVLFPIRATLLLAALIALSFLLRVPMDAAPSVSWTQVLSDYLLSAVTIFAVFVIARQFDIAQRRRAEAVQRASEERYRTIVEAQSELVCRWLPDTTLTFVNEAYCRYFGLPREALVGTSFKNAILAEDLPVIQAALASINRQRPAVTYEHRVVSASGVIGWQHWTDHALFDELGTIVEYQSVGHDITERKLAEVALIASEERYHAIVEIQSEMICRWYPDESVTFVNEAYCRYFGVTREDLIGSPVMAFVYEPDRPLVNAKIAEIDAAHPSATYEHRVFLNGEVRWHLWTDQAIFGSDGQIVEYQSVGRDITNLKHAEEAEREQRRFAEALSDTIALISSTLDLDEVLDRILNQVAVVNPLTTVEILLIEGNVARVVRSHGHSAQQREDIMKVRFNVDETANLRDMKAAGKPLLIPDTHNFPGWIAIEASRWIRATLGAPIRLESETIGFLSINSDKPDIFNEQHAVHLQAFADQAAIAIRNARLYDEVRDYARVLEVMIKDRTDELELTDQRLRAILDGTGEGIFYTENEKVQYINLTFSRLTGYTSEELVGQDYAIFYNILPDLREPAQMSAARKAISNYGVWRGEMPVRRKDGTFFDAGLTVSVIGSPTALPLRAVTVVRDISREKALHAQRSNLVAYASHELRTPITNMKTRLYLLRRRPELLDEHLVILDEVTERMRHLVEDLLDISRLEHGIIPMHRKEVILQEVIHTVIALQQPEAERKNLALRAHLTDSQITVSADRERLVQVITNLVTNALNYTPSGGTVEVILSQSEDSGLIEVVDTGIGIAPEHLPYIFQPFYRVVSEVEGTGLGLSIVKEIVELHDGGIEVRSRVGLGSCFSIRLPLLKAVEVS